MDDCLGSRVLLGELTLLSEAAPVSNLHPCHTVAPSHKTFNFKLARRISSAAAAGCSCAPGRLSNHKVCSHKKQNQGIVENPPVDEQGVEWKAHRQPGEAEFFFSKYLLGRAFDSSSLLNVTEHAGKCFCQWLSLTKPSGFSVTHSWTT